jgi:2-oxoglutarate ferredoxin oxidoreductase subunit gamma
MRYEIRIGGFGGQGVITMGHLLGTAVSLHMGLQAVMMESYGPEARGGSCKTDVVVSNAPIDYPKTTRLDCLVAMNPDAYNSYIKEVKEGGVVVFDCSLFTVESETTGIKYFAVPATKLAQGLGNSQVANVVMLGSLSEATGLVSLEALNKAVTNRFPKASALNIKALLVGAESVRKAKE